MFVKVLVFEAVAFLQGMISIARWAPQGWSKLGLAPVSRVLNVLKRSLDEVPPLEFLLGFSGLSRATSTTQPKTGLFAALALTLTNSAIWPIFVL